VVGPCLPARLLHFLRGNAARDVSSVRHRLLVSCTPSAFVALKSLLGVPEFVLRQPTDVTEVDRRRVGLTHHL
jgi:hypothetical protein